MNRSVLIACCAALLAGTAVSQVAVLPGFEPATQGDFVFVAKVTSAVAGVASMSDPPRYQFTIKFEDVEMINGDKPDKMVLRYTTIDDKAAFLRAGAKVLVKAQKGVVIGIEPATPEAIKAAGGKATSGPASAAAQPMPAATATGPAATRPARGLELARPGTFKEYIDRYTGDDVGCTIGGQAFRNFKLEWISSIDETQLNGQPNPAPRIKPEEMRVTPVNYVKDGRRWVGFRFTNTKDGLELLGGPKDPMDFKHVKDHQGENAGYQTVHHIRFEAHASEKWQFGKLAYGGLVTDKLVDGIWNEEKNVGPGSRGNLGWRPGRIGQNDFHEAFNLFLPLVGPETHLRSTSRNFGGQAKAPRENEDVIQFEPGKEPAAFEVRFTYGPKYALTHVMYGINTRINCHHNVNTRWKVDYLEYSFSNPSVTDEIWTADGKNKAAPTKALTPEVKADLPKPAFSGEKLALELAEGVKLDLVKIPAGKFIMGSPPGEKDRFDNEGVQRIVTISKPFYMGAYEVTQEQYEAVMGKNPFTFKDPKRPADMIFQTDAAEFCRKASAKTGRKMRLPTEGEWEYACRAGSATPYSYGADDTRAAEFVISRETCVAAKEKGYQPVGKKKPNAWGLYDMHGNVWEYCGDWYEVPTSSEAVTDPRGPDKGEYPVVRGGACGMPARYLRSALRVRFAPVMTDGGMVGFRVVCEAE
ncbi:MAG: formylglycine-generating enzyme family protein [Phycisphaerae bacterium]